jgi:hypothetical protein
MYDKKIILSFVNTSDSSEVGNEKKIPVFNGTEILDNSNLSIAQKKLKIGELLVNQEEYSDIQIKADTLWKNSSRPESRGAAVKQLFENIKSFLPENYSPALENNAEALTDVIRLRFNSSISDEEKKDKINKLLTERKFFPHEKLDNRQVTLSDLDPVTHPENILNNSPSLDREPRELISFTTSGSCRTTDGILRKLFDPFIWLYEKLQQADRLVTGTASQSGLSESWLSDGQSLMKKAVVINDPHSLIQDSVNWIEVASSTVKTADPLSVNQSLITTQVGIHQLC